MKRWVLWSGPRPAAVRYAVAVLRSGSWRLLIFAVLMLGLSACVGFTVKRFSVQQALHQGDPAMALQAMDTAGYRKRDRVLYQLDKAMLLSMLGQYHESNELLEPTKAMMEQLSATSLTENLTALTINEGTRSYVGQPYEQLFVYAYKALNYLALGDSNAARVEMLQADVKLREWASAKDIEGITSSAFVRYLAGIVFELNKEWDNALIAYRKSYAILKENEQAIPVCLQQDLLRLTDYRGLKGEHDELREVFNVEAWPTQKQLAQQAQVVLIYHQGLVSSMHEQSIVNFSPELSHTVRISVPYYPLRGFYMSATQLRVGAEYSPTQVIEDVEQLARRNLELRMPGIVLRTMARVVAKKAIAKNASKDNVFAGFLTNIAGIVTEVADTRSWSSLPATIQVARVAVAPGQHRLNVPARAGMSVNQAPSSNSVIELKAGQIKVISMHGLVH